MNKLKTTLILAAILIATTAYGQKTVNKTYSGVKSIRLETASGSGIIKKSSSNEVKVTLEYTYDEDDYKPTFEQRGDRLIIDEDFGNRRRSSWGNRGRAEWTLEVPDGIELDYRSGSGSIEIDGVNVELNVSTGSGSIEVIEANGDMRVNTGSGSIRFTDIEGRMDANTGSGSIRVRNAKGNVELNTGSGSITLDRAEGELDINTGSGRIEASMVTLTGPSELNTGSGSIQVELAAELSDDLDISTGSGSATLDYNGNKIEGEFYLKTNKRSDIRAPFSFDKEYEEDGRGWRDRDVRIVKEAKIGSKDIKVTVQTGSGDIRIRN